MYEVLISHNIKDHYCYLQADYIHTEELRELKLCLEIKATKKSTFVFKL